MSDVVDGGETFFPHAKEWFERDHDEYLQRNTCPNENKDSCLYPSLTPTRGKISYPKNFTALEVLDLLLRFLTVCRWNRRQLPTLKPIISVISFPQIPGKGEWLDTAGWISFKESHNVLFVDLKWLSSH